jgi:CO/xanthine dehydrogenase Mo-binding subunit
VFGGFLGCPRKVKPMSPLCIDTTPNPINTPDAFARYRALANDSRHAIVAADRGDVANATGTTLEALYESTLAGEGALEPTTTTGSIAMDGGGSWRVQVVWPREWRQESPYRSRAVNRIRGVLDAAGNLIALEHTVVMDSIAVPPEFRFPSSAVEHGPNDLLDNMPYDVASYRMYYVDPQNGVPSGSLRASGANWNNFVVETFIDELAHVAHQDPAVFRIRLLEHDLRAVNVIQTVVERAGTPASGTQHGLAYGVWNGTRVATVAEVSMQGALPCIHRTWSVVDRGCEQVFKAESDSSPLAAAVANAIFALTGERLRSQPFPGHVAS